MNTKATDGVAGRVDVSGRAGPDKTEEEIQFASLTGSLADIFLPETQAGRTLQPDPYKDPEVLYHIYASYDPARYPALGPQLADAGPQGPNRPTPDEVDWAIDKAGLKDKAPLARAARQAIFWEITKLAGSLSDSYPDGGVVLLPGNYDPGNPPDWKKPPDWDKSPDQRQPLQFILLFEGKDGKTIGGSRVKPFRGMPLQDVKTVYEIFGPDGSNKIDAHKIAALAEFVREHLSVRGRNDPGDIVTAQGLKGVAYALRPSNRDAAELLDKAAEAVMTGVLPGEWQNLGRTDEH
jgi:hypothetical protein